MLSNTNEAKKIKKNKEIEENKNTKNKNTTVKTTQAKSKASKTAKTSSKTSEKKSTADKKTQSIKVASKSAADNKKSKTKQVDNNKNTKSTAKKATVSKNATKKDSVKTTNKKEATKKATSKKVTKKVSTSKKETSKKVTEKALTISPTQKKILNENLIKVEYYDLPFRYNETVVKILAQTPKKLFIYWDISDKDIENYKTIFGENFYFDTYPVLLVHNLDMNYTFEVPVNDFANSWYLDINDPKCKYEIELGRKFKNNNVIIKNSKVLEETPVDLQNNYLRISTSNTLEAPNNRILFDTFSENVTYRNVKTNVDSIKNITELPNYKKIGNIVKLYEKIYENDVPTYSELMHNPSSAGNPSSSFFK